jgi:hypothetical protein
MDAVFVERKLCLSSGSLISFSILKYKKSPKHLHHKVKLKIKTGNL